MILLDMDGPLADLHTEWLRRHEERTGHRLDPADLADWSLSAVPAEHRAAFSAILNEPDLYDSVPPTPGALEALQVLDAHGVPWLVATANSSLTMVAGKIRWLKRHGLSRDESGTDKDLPGNLIATHRKNLIRGDLLVDDGVHNLRDFPGGRLLFDAPWNEQVEDFGGDRAKGWDGVLTFLRRTGTLPAWS